MSRGGAAAGKAMTRVLLNAGLITQEEFDAIPGIDVIRKGGDKAPRTIGELGIGSGFSKGGLVDGTGLAMLHGSSSNPEMVLDPQQTQMFMNLRDILSKVTIGSGGSESIVIEKIEIKTDKLNGKQDFDAAGKILANAFNKARQNRGITTNVKR